MKKVDIVLVGSSPGIHVCAIYLHTANIPLTVVVHDCGLSYRCGYVAGIPGIDAGEFTKRCRQQVENMEVCVVDGGDLKITREGEQYTVVASGNSYRADILVLDRDVDNLASNRNVLLIENEVYCEEAIDVAGAGCRVAFAIKEIVS